MKRLGFMVLLMATLSGVQAREYFVSPEGRASNDGSLNAPLKSIQSAVDKLAPGDICYVRKGIYHETVAFSKSGTTGQPIKLSAYPNEAVIISAADSIGGWQPLENGLYRAPVSWRLEPGEDQLFINGVWYPEARFPNFEHWTDNHCTGCSSNIPGSKNGPCCDVFFVGPPQAKRDILHPVVYRSARFANNGKDNIGTPLGTCIVAFPKRDTPFFGKGKDYWKDGALWMKGSWWGAGGAIVESYDQADSTYLHLATDRLRWFGEVVVLGHPGLIDKPGEWAVKDGYVYIMPPSGLNLNSASVMLKRRYLALNLSGQSNIEVSGFTVIGGSVTTDSLSSYCTLDKCHFYCLSHYATIKFFDNGSFAGSIPDIQSGKRGIYFSGHHNTLKNSSILYSAASGVLIDGEGHAVLNNFMSYGNYLNTYAAHVYILRNPVASRKTPNAVDMITISHNTLEYSGRSNMTGGLVCKVTHNKFYNSMILSSDGGTVYTFGTPDRGAGEFAYNEFKNCFGEPSAYLYTDGCAGSNDIMHHNVWLHNDIPKGKFIVGLPGCHKKFYNNTFIAHTDGRPDTLNYVFTIWDNIPNTTEGYPWGTEGDWKNNLDASYSKQKTLPDWMFTDTLKENYTLRAGSPAIDKGVPVAGITDGFQGSAPDLGAYESGVPAWKAGHDWGAPTTIQTTWGAITGYIAGASSRGRPLAPTPLFMMTKNQLKIDNQGNKDISYSLFNARGALVLSGVVKPQCTNTTTLKPLASGIYLVRAATGNTVQSTHYIHYK